MNYEIKTRNEREWLASKEYLAGLQNYTHEASMEEIEKVMGKVDWDKFYGEEPYILCCGCLVKVSRDIFESL